jgi:hypothetical protein
MLLGSRWLIVLFKSCTFLVIFCFHQLLSDERKSPVIIGDLYISPWSSVNCSSCVLKLQYETHKRAEFLRPLMTPVLLLKDLFKLYFDMNIASPSFFSLVLV